MQIMGIRFGGLAAPIKSAQMSPAQACRPAPVTTWPRAARRKPHNNSRTVQTKGARSNAHQLRVYEHKRTHVHKLHHTLICEPHTWWWWWVRRAHTISLSLSLPPSVESMSHRAADAHTHTESRHYSASSDANWPCVCLLCARALRLRPRFIHTADKAGAFWGVAVGWSSSGLR